MTDAVRSEIERLRKLKTKALKAKYLELFGEESRSSNSSHLFRRIAWRVQALASGDLSDRARERARQLAVDADLRLRAPGSFWKQVDAAKATATSVHRDPRLPPAGTELTRKHNGQMIQVRVLEHGFKYNGKRYGSLSAIAYQATRTRWNGFSFFGLKKRVDNG